VGIDLQAARTAVEHITGGWRAQAVYTAVKLRLPDHVHEGVVTARGLAVATAGEEEGIRRLMRLLVTMGVFEGDGTAGYRGTAVSGVLLDRPGSMRDMCLLHGEQYYAAWAYAATAIPSLRSGFELAYGQTLYAHLREHEDVSQRFQSSLKAGNGFFHAVPEVVDFRGKHVVDVGGGTGELLATVLAATPDARGTLFDLPHVADAARERPPDVGPGRLDIVGGDMFEGVPRGGDVYLLSRVFAAYGDEMITLLFKDIHQALSDPAARLLILDRFVVDDGCPLLPALWDLHLLMTVGGGHRSRSDVDAMLGRAGLHVEKSVELPLDHTALIVATSR
jgi:hypothetical protein